MLKFLVVVLLAVVAVYSQDTVTPTHHTRHPHTGHTKQAHTQHPHTQHPHTQHPHTGHTPNVAHSNVKATFTKVDADHDGMITLAEVEAAFKAADKDGDNHLSMAEYKAVHPELADDLAMAMYKYFDVNENQQVDMRDLKLIFHQYDVNGDHNISMHEFQVEYSAVHNLLTHPDHTKKPIIG